MGRFWNTITGNKDDNIECEHLVNYDGRSIGFGGIKIGEMEIGKLQIDRKTLQSASQALMLLDQSQYDLCKSVKNLKDKDKREKYVELMIQDKLQSQKLMKALAGLSISPESKELNETLQKLLLANTTRTLEIEDSELSQRIQTQNEITGNSIEIGKESFKTKIQDINQVEPQLDTISLNSQARITTKSQNKVRSEGLNDITNAIYDLNEKYNHVLFKGDPILELLEESEPLFKTLRDRKNRKIIGGNNQNSIDNLLINLSTTITEFKNANQLGDQNQISLKEKNLKHIFGIFLNVLDDIKLTMEDSSEL